MNIQFHWEKFLEDDDTWEALFVKTTNKNWHLAQQHYGTENEEEIRKLLSS